MKNIIQLNYYKRLFCEIALSILVVTVFTLVSASWSWADDQDYEYSQDTAGSVDLGPYSHPSDDTSAGTYLPNPGQSKNSKVSKTKATARQPVQPTTGTPTAGAKPAKQEANANKKGTAATSSSPKAATKAKAEEEATETPRVLDSASLYTVEYYVHAATNNQVLIMTDFGPIVIVLHPSWAPASVATFKKLIRNHYYDHTSFYRLFSDYFIQGGDPSETGIGDAGIKMPNESNIERKFVAGTVALSNKGNDPATTGSQFFITTISAPWLDGKFNVIGSVFSGLDVIRSFFGRYDTNAQGMLHPTIPFRIYILSDYLKHIPAADRYYVFVARDQKVRDFDKLLRNLNISPEDGGGPLIEPKHEISVGYNFDLKDLPLKISR